MAGAVGDPWRGVVIKPGLLWRIEHVFTVKDGEPTELYLALMRLGGGFFISRPSSAQWWPCFKGTSQ